MMEGRFKKVKEVIVYSIVKDLGVPLRVGLSPTSPRSDQALIH
jgi:hypothetical protein